MINKLLRIIPRVGFTLSFTALAFGLFTDVPNRTLLNSAMLCVFHAYMAWTFWDLE